MIILRVAGNGDGGGEEIQEVLKMVRGMVGDTP